MEALEQAHFDKLPIISIIQDNSISEEFKIKKIETLFESDTPKFTMLILNKKNQNAITLADELGLEKVWSFLIDKFKESWLTMPPRLLNLSADCLFKETLDVNFYFESFQKIRNNRNEKSLKDLAKLRSLIEPMINIVKESGTGVYYPEDSAYKKLFTLLTYFGKNNSPASLLDLYILINQQQDYDFSFRELNTFFCYSYATKESRRELLSDLKHFTSDIFNDPLDDDPLEYHDVNLSAYYKIVLAASSYLSESVKDEPVPEANAFVKKEAGEYWIKDKQLSDSPIQITAPLIDWIANEADKIKRNEEEISNKRKHQAQTDQLEQLEPNKKPRLN